MVSSSQQQKQLMPPVSSSVSKRQRTIGKRTSKKVPRTYARARVPRSMVSFIGAGSVFPQRLRTVMKFSVIQLAETNASGLATHVFRANSIQNVDASSYEPKYFSELMAIYDHYSVYYSVCRVKMLQPPITGGVITSLWVDDDSSLGVTTYRDALEKPGAVVNTTHFDLQNGPKTLSSSYNAFKTFGPGAIENSRLIGNIVDKPVETQYFALCAVSSVATQTIRYLVEIDFHVEFSELATI